MSRSDYLEALCDFQRREIDQGRRVAIIVTSRIAVANRVRYPEGTVIMELEPFDGDQIARWVRIWNEANANSNIDPLSAKSVLTHLSLAEQPLLLLMLALYDADGNALRRHADGLARAELYERLLTKFVDLEIGKQQRALDETARAAIIATELRLLSVLAFAMFNRGQKSVAEEDLDSDLASLLPQQDNGSIVGGQFARRLSKAQLAVGRFYFVRRSEALLDSTRLNEYEFLHATFGEYLVARLVFHILSRIVRLNEHEDPGLVSGSEPSDDDLWTLLSFTPFTDTPQAVGFLAELITKLDGERSAGLRNVLRVLFRRSLRPRQKGYGGYEPRSLNVTARHGAYSANLLILNILAARRSLPAAVMFASKKRAVENWQTFAQLLRSQLDPASWDGLTSVIAVTSRRDGNMTEVETSVATADWRRLPEDLRTTEWLTPRPYRSWRFLDTGPATLVCAQLPNVETGSLADLADPNYIELLSFADLDALVELHGHIRAENPMMDVFYKAAPRVVPDDLSGHCILLGGIAWNGITKRLSAMTPLPVRRIADPSLTTGQMFVVEGNGEEQAFFPVWGDDDHTWLVEDVGLLARMPNPLNTGRTLTICNGIHSHGVLGAVRSLTDARMRDSNERYISSSFSETGSFAILMRVPVLQGQAMTPDFSIPGTVVYRMPLRHG
jgi:hypothetical protein